MIKVFKDIKLITSVALLLVSINITAQQAKIRVGAERMEIYLEVLKNKNIAVVANHSSMIGSTHLVDSLLSLGIKVKRVFSPEHGFRGKADAGEAITNTIDKKTGLPIISLYGNHKKPYAEDMKGIDIVLFDIQDVGVRYYTYISTMHYVMEAAAEHKVQMIILDRPNPNGFYVDGPSLKNENKSFVGIHNVPLVHGMTVAEYGRMVNSEGWLKDSIKCDLTYVLVENYTHDYKYSLPVKPSPNLPNMRSIYLYPSLGLFEGTVISVARGTEFPFQAIGHPSLTNSKFKFTPVSMPGASKTPPYKGIECKGLDLREGTNEKFTLKWVLYAFNNYPKSAKEPYFNNFFNNLIGDSRVKKMILDGKTEAEISQIWQEDLEEFKILRNKYLLYPDYTK